MEHLKTFKDFLRYQGVDAGSTSSAVIDVFRREYEDALAAVAANDVTNVVRVAPPAGEHRYAIAIQDGEALWLTLWIRRSPRGEWFVLYPGRGPDDPHASYHATGQYHQKTSDVRLAVKQLQPLADFKGTEHLGAFYGHGTEIAICYPEAFTSVLRVPKGILEGTRGCVLIDLVEPGEGVAAHHRQLPGQRILIEETYRESSPWLSVAIAEQTQI